MAASLPDGNIKPYNKSSTSNHSPSSSYAVVPFTSAAVGDTEKNNYLASNLKRFINRKETMQVMIFVKDAISLDSLERYPLRYVQFLAS